MQIISQYEPHNRGAYGGCIGFIGLNGDINQAITITASVTMVCYIMYTVSPEVAARANTEYLYLTTCFVLVGLLRYIQLTVVDKRSGDPTKIMLRDRFTQIVVVLFTLTFFFIIYM